MLSTRIKELRSEKGLLQRDVAARLGVSQQAVGRWEKGQTEPNAEAITKLAEYFDCTTDYLLGNTDTRTPPDTDSQIVRESPTGFMAGTGNISIEALTRIIRETVREALDEREKDKND